MYSFHKFRRLLFLCLPVLLASVWSSVTFGQTTANELAQKLQDKFTSQAGVKLQFNVRGHDHVAVTISGKRVRIESGELLLISDGNAIWNYNKKSSTVTIDKPSGGSNSPFADPMQLLRFASNYSAEGINRGSGKFELDLIPNAALAPLFQLIGGMDHMQLTLKSTRNNISIQHVSIFNQRGQTDAGSLSIRALRHVAPQSFVFHPTASMKVLDLRE